MSRIAPWAVASFFVALGALVPRAAHALDDCPPGSMPKAEGGFEWCEPSICESDGQCRDGEVCRPLPLCVQVGQVGAGGVKDGGAARLVATQRCAPDKSCPATTVCADKSRCVARTTADRLGLLTSADLDAGARAAAEPAKRSACGCRTAGSGGGSTAAFALGLAGLGLAVARRRRLSPGRADRA